ncbi:hypothetical protein ACOMHN_020728 [Nucella lapillus]
MRHFFLVTILLCAVLSLHAYPTPDPDTCIPQNEECDPAVTGFHYGTVQCCAWFQACVRHGEPTHNSTGHRCSPIYIG